MRIKINSELTPITRKWAVQQRERSHESVRKQLSSKGEAEGYDTLLSDSEGSLSHLNMLGYLEYAYGYHYNPVISPDMIWYTILCELAGVLKKSPEKYRDLFTQSKEKEDIAVEVGGFRNNIPVLNIEEFKNELQKLVPQGVENFLFDFSTSDASSKMAISAAFMDAVSPYYTYSMYCCGFPEIVIQGTLEDWKKLRGGVITLSEKLKGRDLEIDKWMTRCNIVSSKFISVFEDPENAKAEMLEMFGVEECGSGSQTIPKGWLLDLFVELPSFALFQNFPTHVSVVDYTVEKVKYKLRAGLFGSVINPENNDLEPCFCHSVTVVVEEPKEYIP